MRLTHVLLILIALACCRQKPNSEVITKVDSVAIDLPILKRDTITALDEKREPGDYIFKTKKGNYLVMRVENQTDSVEQYEDEGDNPGLLSDSRTCNTDSFEGTDRGKVKTTKSRAILEKNVDAKKLFSDLSKDEGQLCADANTFLDDKRKKIENRNIQLNTVYLYTFKRQKDEDYHLVVGTTSNPKTAYFFNVEISGEPPAGANGRTEIIQARTDFEAYFELAYCANNYYDQDWRQTPVPVIITGSLFFDAFHCRSFQNSGPQKWKEIKLQTAWEIHPITKIEFLR
jgi:hypothetical protein